MHHDDFWQVSLREYDLITAACCRGKDQEFRARRILQQEAAILTQFAFHDPKNMPDFTKRDQAQEPVKRNKEHDLEKLRAGLIHMHFLSQKR